MIKVAFLLAEVESRTQRSRPRQRPRIQKTSEAKGPNLLEQTLSRPSTGLFEAKDQGHNFASVLKKKKVIELVTEVKVKFYLFFFLFNESKNSAVLEPTTGYFRGLLSFEAQAKDLNFQTNAEDFKICF